MSDKYIRMAILDDGVHPDVCPLTESYLIDDDLHITTLKKNTVSPYSHGSMCARIVQQYTELDKVDIFSIKILHEDTWQGNVERLLKAFELCVSMDIQLIHLSVGTYAFEDFAKLEEAVQRLLDSNRFLVAATGNQETVTYPAYLPGVIGVQHHPELKDDEYIYYHDSFTRINFHASSRHKLIIDGEETESSVSNSYAAPVITASILSYLKGNTQLEKKDVVHLLIENAGSHMLKNISGFLCYPPVEIPVVVLSGFSIKRLSSLLELLVERLRREDYHARIATNLPGTRPWDETMIPDAIDLDLFIARMVWYFSCEIVLLGVTSYIPPDRYANVSLWIYGDESRCFLLTTDQANEQILQAEGLLDIEVYDFLIKALT